MKVGIVSVYQDQHRRGAPARGVLQPQAGPLLAAILPEDADVELINDAWEDPPWERSYDLLLISCLHPDFDRARQISHYWRRRGALTVLGGAFASSCPELAAPYFDAVVVGDPEDTLPQLYDDACRGELRRLYRSRGVNPALVPTPRFDLTNPAYPVPISLEATRGCPFTCRFCGQTITGPRFLPRPVEHVVRDIRAAQRSFAGRLRPGWDRLVFFADNNIGGNLQHLRALCAALEPLQVRWASSATFNVIEDSARVGELARSGCRLLFVGLESFNPEVLRSMRKVQNRVDRYRAALDQCREAGIVIISGLVLDPQVDGLGYLESLPRRLDEAGLVAPTFVAFEAPLPGTARFTAAVEQGPGALLPGAYLRDLTGYTLATRPVGASPERYIQGYRELLGELFSRRRRWAHVLDREVDFLRRGQRVAAFFHLVTHSRNRQPVVPGRSYLARTDTAPPESVPLEERDFRDARERALVLDPWVVADGCGAVLPAWTGSAGRVVGGRGVGLGVGAELGAGQVDEPLGLEEGRELRVVGV